MNVVLQPCSNAISRKHFQQTVQNPVRVDEIQKFLSSDKLNHLQTEFPDGQVSLWGVAPKGGEINPRTFEKLSVGDVVLFSDSGFFVASGVVALKFEDERLARHLWGQDADGETWQYMYAIKNLRTINISCERVSKAIGYKPLFIYRTFRVLDENRSKAFIESFPDEILALGLDSQSNAPTDVSNSNGTQSSPLANQVIAAINDLSVSEILSAIDEWKRIGKDEFLARYQVDKAVRYLIKQEDSVFDAKAILVAALRTFRPELGQFKASIFNGNVHTVAAPLRALGFDVVDIIDDKRDIEDDKHEAEILSRSIKGPVEIVQLIHARRGQGVFRDNVLSREPRCRITGISDPSYLRASHIKPWSKCDDVEKIDGDNGLMLSPHVDFLFDRGLISFQDDGELMVSQQIRDGVLSAWAISCPINVGSFSAGQRKYLQHHRECEFKK
jgi:hypothetical protein